LPATEQDEGHAIANRDARMIWPIALPRSSHSAFGRFRTNNPVDDRSLDVDGIVDDAII
jgi:hypothetical protein